MLKKITVSFLLVALLLPFGPAQAATYTPLRGQSVVIAKTNQNAAVVSVLLADLRSISAQSFGISIFGNDYNVDVAHAQFQNAAGATVTIQSFTVGKRIIVLGTLDATDTSLIHAQVVRDTGLTGGTGGFSCSGPATAAVNTNVVFTASGATGTPTWKPAGGTANGSTYTIKFTTQGAKTVTTTVAGQTAMCNIQITAAGDDGALTGLTDSMWEHAKTGANITTPAVTQNLWKKSTLADWNGNHWGDGQRGGVGSQNIPLIAEAAAGHYQFFADLANLDKQEGLYGREFGSPGFYFSFPFAAKVVALRDARRAGDTAAATAIANEMQAVLTLWSLVAVQTPRTSEVANLRGTIYNGSGNAGHYNGLSVAVAGERWHSRTIADDEESDVLSWALDMPRSINTNAASHLRTGSGKWWQNDIAWVAGVDSYSQTTDPSVWGLTADSRSKLQSIVRGETANIPWAISVIKDYGIWKWSPVRLRRTTEGVETVFFNSQNGNKSAEAYTSITNSGAWKSMRPCEGSTTGNPGYEVHLVNGDIVATGDAPACTTVTQAPLGGNIIYEIMINGHSVTSGANQPEPVIGGGGGGDSPDPQNPPDDDGGDGGGGGGGGGVRDPFDRNAD